MKILIVDDFASVRLFHASLLGTRGHVCISVANGQEALTQLSKQSVDLVLLDLLMPEMGGEEFLARIRAEHRFQNLPVVIITSEQQNKWATDPRVSILNKPVVPAKLVQAVEEALKVTRAP